MGRIAAQLELLVAETPDLHHPLGVRQLAPVREVVLVRLGVRGILADGDFTCS
jgi:hypothetical protein